VTLATIGGASAWAPARADELQRERQVALDTQWPGLPAWHGLKLEDQIVDRLSELGNRAGDHLDTMSHDWIKLHVDGRAQRAHLHFGGGNSHYLSLQVDSDWHFADGKARVQARLELGLAGHTLDVKIPDVDLKPDSYHGTQMVDVNVPLLERRF
jgi:hypothetical protein